MQPPKAGHVDREDLSALSSCPGKYADVLCNWSLSDSETQAGQLTCQRPITRLPLMHSIVTRSG